MDSQVYDLKKYIKANRLGPCRWYKDTVSDKADHRPGLEKLIRRVEQGHISCILTWELSRLSRKGIEPGMSLIGPWLDRGIRIISLRPNFDWVAPPGSGRLDLFLAGQKKNMTS